MNRWIMNSIAGDIIDQRLADSKSGHRNGKVIVVGPVSIACQEGYYVC